MRKSSTGHAGQAIERVLELSADAQITRRKTPKDSPAFHSLTGAIAAYGKHWRFSQRFNCARNSTQSSLNMNCPSTLQRLAEEQTFTKAINSGSRGRRHGTAFDVRRTHMHNQVPKYVTQKRAALLLGIPEKELSRISGESELGHTERTGIRKRHFSLTKS